MPRKPKVAPEEHDNAERWTVTYSDLMNLLLVFFIVLYATANQDTEKAKEVLSAIAGSFNGTEFILDGTGSDILETFSGESLAMMENQNMQEIKEEIESLAMGVPELSEDAIEVTIDEIGVHIRIKDAVLFKSGSADISNADATFLLNKIGNALKKFPTNYIQIEGHTDNVPMSGNIKNLETNWELGSLRAVKVLRTLVRDCGLNAEFLSATSYGEFKPIADNSTIEGRSKNRRVEITILRNYAVEKTD